MIHIQQFKDHIIVPTLKKIGLHSDAAVQLLLGTAVQESRLMYLKQLKGGPAIGFYQIEVITLNDIYVNFLK